MSNAEIEVRGTGRVLAIEDCPLIADGEGSVVISRIKTHHAGKLIELQFENGEILTGTASHPIWSADRQDWVPLGELREGEHTQSRDGLLRITRRLALPDMQPVYNLEVDGEHVYEVTQAGVLVHNDDCTHFILNLPGELNGASYWIRDSVGQVSIIGIDSLDDLGMIFRKGAESGMTSGTIMSNKVVNPKLREFFAGLAASGKSYRGGRVTQLGPDTFQVDFDAWPQQ